MKCKILLKEKRKKEKKNTHTHTHKTGGQLPTSKEPKIWFEATNVPFKLIYKCFVVGNNQAQSIIEAYEFLLALIIIPIILVSSPLD